MSEALSYGFFLFFLLLAFLRRIESRARLRVFVLGGAGLLLLSAPRVLDGLLSAQSIVLLKQILPAPLMLFAYWQAGQFFVAPWAELQSWLGRLDTAWFWGVLQARREGRIPRWLLGYLELTYALCYLVVPAALGWLYLLGRAHYAAEFWSIVLPPSYLCYALLPFLQTLPPRAIEPETVTHGAALPRILNLWVLRHGSIHANTFPSAHVAASVAAALALLEVSTFAALGFLWVALSIAVASCLCRYHYVLDVILGALLALLSYALHLFLQN